MLQERISLKEASALRRVFFHLIQNGNFVKLKSSLQAVFHKYKHHSPYAVHALIGELAVHIPPKEFANFSDFLLNNLNVCSHELTEYLHKRIKMTLANTASKKPSINDELIYQADDIIKRAIELDQNLALEKTESPPIDQSKFRAA
jgi:hypothetical protein